MHVSHAGLTSALSSSLESGALLATATATFKLLMLCGLVGWLLRSRRLPPETPTTLSQVHNESLLSSEEGRIWYILRVAICITPPAFAPCQSCDRGNSHEHS